MPYTQEYLCLVAGCKEESESANVIGSNARMSQLTVIRINFESG